MQQYTDSWGEAIFWWGVYALAIAVVAATISATAIILILMATQPATTATVS